MARGRGLCAVMISMAGMAAHAAGPAVAAHRAVVCPAVTRVGVSDLGYSAFRHGGGGMGGISIDTANELARRTGCKIEFRWFPRQRLFVELEAGRIDMTMGAVRAPERDRYAAFLPYAYVQYDLILSRNADRQFHSLAEFAARSSARLNLTRGIKYGEPVEGILDAMGAAGRLESVNDFETVFNKLAMGRADGTLASPPIYSKYLDQGGLRQQLVVIPLPESPPQLIGVYLSRRTVASGARQAYVAALKAMVQEQTVPTVYGKYFDDATVRRTFRQGGAPLLAELARWE